MRKLRKVSHQNVPLVSSFESADSIREPFVPNDFAEDGSYPMSMVVIFLFFSSYVFISSLCNQFFCFGSAVFLYFFRNYLVMKEPLTKLFSSSMLIKLVICFLFLVLVVLCCWLFSLVEVTFGFMFFQKVKSLKRKLSSAGRRNVVSPFPLAMMLSFSISLFILLFTLFECTSLIYVSFLFVVEAQPVY